MYLLDSLNDYLNTTQKSNYEIKIFIDFSSETYIKSCGCISLVSILLQSFP